MRRRIIISFYVVVLITAFYELAFRYCTAASGEVDMEAQPPRVYYSEDLLAPFPWRRALFGLRTDLPFGKVPLAKRTGAYVDGGRIYRRLSDGSWQDVTDAMIEHQKHTKNGNGASGVPAKGSEPGRPETNSTSSADGYRR